METDKRKFYIFDLNGTLYNDTKILLEMKRVCKNYISERLIISTKELDYIIPSLLKKHKTNSFALAFRREFNWSLDKFVADTYLKVDISNIYLNRKITRYVKDPKIQKAIFTDSPRKYVEKVVSTLEIKNLINEMITLEDLGINEKATIPSFLLVSKMLKTNDYKQIFFWDDKKENREIGSLLGWIPMIP